jgi:hypothetical protein
VRYQTGSWPRVLGRALRRVSQLARPDMASTPAHVPSIVRAA